VNVTIKPLPVVRTIKDSTICGNQNIVLTTTGAQTYTWSPAAGLDNAGSSAPVFSGTQGSSTYFVTGTGANNCSAKDTIKITVRDVSLLVAPPDKEMCQHASVVLNGNNGSTSTYAWSPAGSLSDATIINPVATPASTQAYTLIVTDRVCNFTKTYTVNVLVDPLPIVDASKSNDITCANPTARLSATGAVTYSWAPAGTLTNANTATPVAKPQVNTLYTVTGKSAKGCVNTDTVTVFVNTGIGGFAIPNTFTPNGDGTNDCFGVRHWGNVQQLVFIIYNRWGEKVFETNNPAVCWDGKYKGNDAERGNYVYFIKGTVGCGEMTRKGNVLLVR
jgi:gliding motility-associated-like protein